MYKIAKMRVGLVLPVALVMASTSWGETKSVSYIDADGTEKSQTCTLLSSVSEDNIGKLTTGCYVVDKNLGYSTQMATEDGDLTLILADGKTLTVTNSGDDALIASTKNWVVVGYTTAMKNLTIYGQKEQTGKLVLSGRGGTLSSWIGQTGRGIHAKNLTINGGVISVTSESSDGIYVSENVIINGGSVSVSATSSSYNGLKAAGTITLGWRNLTDYVKASSFSGTVKTASGKAFKDQSGNKYEGGKTISSPPANQYLMPYAPVVFVDGKAIVDSSYTGSVAVDIPNVIEASSIDYQRKYTQNIIATIVLPFTLPEGTTTNAKFYGLRTVVQDGCQWRAKMKYIGKNVLPAANTPYIVKVDGTTLTFDLAGGTAKFQTSGNNEVWTEGGDWLFSGNYSFRSWAADDPDLGLYYALFGEGDLHGQFGKISEASSAPAMRAYFKKRDSDVRIVCSTPSGRPAALGESAIVSEIPEIIDVELIDEDEEGEHTTFVGRMNTRTGEIQMKRDYDLKGRKLNGAPTARGAYYGKKVIKK